MSIYDSHKPPVGEGGGLYLKLQDGETVKLRWASEPAIFESEGKDRETGEITLRTQYGWLVWNQDQKIPQVWTQGVRFFKQIAALAQDEEWGDPTGYDIRLTRQGSDTSTTYTVTPSSNRASLPSDAIEQLNKINLIEKIKASPFAKHVMWLSDWDKQVAEQEGKYDQEIDALTAAGEAKKTGHDKARETADSIKAGTEPDNVVTDFDPSEEIDLSNIPF